VVIVDDAALAAANTLVGHLEARRYGPKRRQALPIVTPTTDG
jgi:hypothetical protein